MFGVFPLFCIFVQSFTVCGRLVFVYVNELLNEIVC